MKKTKGVFHDMKQKIISLPAALFLAFLLLPFTLTGCSGEPGQELKDSVLSSFNDLLHSVSRLALTSDGRLTGERTLGEDNYTGSYQADYEDFQGTEYLFGGTGLSRSEGNELSVTYALSVRSGSVRLFLSQSGTQTTLADTAENGSCQIHLTGGDTYIGIEGEDFDGSLSLVVQ